MAISDDVRKNAMDLLATMATEELAEDLHIGTEEALVLFLKSRTGEMLYDDRCKLWWDGPSALCDMVKSELQAAGKFNS